MQIVRPGSLEVSLLEVEKQSFDPKEYTFCAIYKLKLNNNNFLLRKRLKYPSICITNKGKMLEAPLSDLDGEHIEIITIPASGSEVITVKVEHPNPPFTDIGKFSYNLTYFVRGSKRQHKAHISAKNH